MPSNADDDSCTRKGVTQMNTDSFVFSIGGRAANPPQHWRACCEAIKACWFFWPAMKACCLILGASEPMCHQAFWQSGTIHHNWSLSFCMQACWFFWPALAFTIEWRNIEKEFGKRIQGKRPTKITRRQGRSSTKAIKPKLISIVVNGCAHTECVHLWASWCSKHLWA